MKTVGAENGVITASPPALEAKCAAKSSGAERQATRDVAKAAWVADAYAGLPYPTGPNTPLPRRRLNAVIVAHGEPNPRNKHVTVLGHNAHGKEVRYHATKGYRVVMQ